MQDKKTLRNMLVLFYHVAAYEGGQTALIEAGFLKMVDIDLSSVADAHQTMLGVRIKCAENKGNMEEILEKQVSIKRFVSTVPQDDATLKQLSEGLLRLIERMDVNYKTMLKQKQAAGGKSSQFSSPKVKQQQKAAKPAPKPAPKKEPAKPVSSPKPAAGATA